LGRNRFFHQGHFYGLGSATNKVTNKTKCSHTPRLCNHHAVFLADVAAAQMREQPDAARAELGERRQHRFIEQPRTDAIAEHAIDDVDADALARDRGREHVGPADVRAGA
jgi:conjugal transfer/entry exclusion protein